MEIKSKRPQRSQTGANVQRDRRLTRPDDPAAAARFASLKAAVSRPQDPRAASFWRVVEFLLIRLQQEASPTRRDRLCTDARAAVEALLKAASSAATFADQRAAVEATWNALQVGGFRPDFRKHRRSAGPDPVTMANEFDVTREALTAKIGPLRDQHRRNTSRIQRRQLLNQLRITLADLFPDLKSHAPRTLERVVEEPPEQAAYMILGARYRLNPQYVRDRVREGRKLQKTMAQVAKALRGPDIQA